ncbi:MAG TPA: vitamin K epoxide reductase family protein [Candidatus Saccharimonadales bacterium]|nr:vitamin K epoxide reductase family protein [Candidatus Saccharimonadales bacterium]
MPKVKAKRPITLDRVIPWMLVVGGVIGLVCSFIISLDKLRLLQNPNFKPNCDLNPVVSCLSVMASKQGSVFGFPNPWIGLAGFAVLIAVGMAILAGAKFKRWFWLGLEAGITLNLIFAYWLLYESVYTIHALCPYCLAVDVVVITLFWYTTLFLVDEKLLKLPGSWAKAAAFARRHHFDILVVWFLITIVIILKHFWYYYSRFL